MGSQRNDDKRSVSVFYVEYLWNRQRSLGKMNGNPWMPWTITIRVLIQFNFLMFFIQEDKARVLFSSECLSFLNFHVQMPQNVLNGKLCKNSVQENTQNEDSFQLNGRRLFIILRKNVGSVLCTKGM